ncbi:MAG: barstar family protein [Lachnospiraceae bacterium]|nr:barstar family protein [Lachnospiraceae bacterium]MCI8995682.1 barstar family protein [Lachnospiraceae bacterium]MCI9133071.1 barstar family protein [Lachnospiraceae bacterium]
MKSCILDGNLIWDKEMLHQELREALGFPAWYGGNLDALYDCLTDLQEETVICLAHEEELEERLGGYVRMLKRALTEAAAKNPLVRWEDCERI